MRIAYDPEADALVVVFGEGACRSSIWVTEDVAVDLSVGGRPLSIEVLNAARTAGLSGTGRFSATIPADERWPRLLDLHNGRRVTHNFKGDNPDKAVRHMSTSW